MFQFYIKYILKWYVNHMFCYYCSRLNKEIIAFENKKFTKTQNWSDFKLYIWSLTWRQIEQRVDILPKVEVFTTTRLFKQQTIGTMYKQ